MDQQEITHIIQRIQKGEHSAFALLVEEYKDMVYSLCLKMSQSAEDAEDIAQETFIKAFRSIGKFKGNAKFSTWLYQITYFTTINHLKKNKIQTKALNEELPIPSEDGTILQEIQQEERKRYLEIALSHLAYEERALITLFYLKEHSIEEITVIMKITRTNAKTKLHRTRKKLFGIMRTLLNKELETFIS